LLAGFDVADMSEIPARNAATAWLPPHAGPDATPAKVVCTALALALVVLVLRIATIW
jgi:hypothetical protein